MRSERFVVLNGKRYIKPSRAAERIGVSRATIYRLLPKLQAAGVEIIRTSARITVVSESDLDRYITAQGMATNRGVRSPDALKYAQHVRQLILDRHGRLPKGSAAQAVRELREEFGA